MRVDGPSIGVIDYGMGNRRSAEKALEHVGARVEAGVNAHHMIEAAFKAFALALRQAVAIDPGETGVPSTKGTLTR